MSSEVFRITSNPDEQVEEFEQILGDPALISIEGSKLLLLARKFSKIEDLYQKRNSPKLIPRKVAILASYSTQHLVSVLKLFLYKEGISPEFFEGDYDGIALELLNPDSEVYKFKPEILLLLTDQKDIKEYPSLFSDKKTIDTWVDSQVQFYANLWSRVSAIPDCQIFQTTFVLPIYRPLGNLEANYLFTPTNCLKFLNLELIRNKPPNVFFIDMDYYASYFGKRRWYDDKNYYLSKQGFSFGAYGLVCNAFAKVLSNSKGVVKKCLVLDLDNTLWGGVIGDDGVEGINISPTDAVGEAFRSFQDYLKKLRDRGVILAICSKNSEKTAKLPFEQHPDMILSLSDIACFSANWDDKASNIQNISSRLNIGMDSLVFFDDNPFERDIVHSHVPSVQVIEVPEDPALFIHALDSAMSFEWNQLTEEDLLRSDTYIADKERNELSEKAVDYGSYLKQLKMVAFVETPSPAEISRFTQLINKSNQFNLRTRRYTEAASSQMSLEKDRYSLVSISLQDKFGKYGIISCVILERIDDRIFIDTWVMSCRVLKRGVEDVAFNKICEVGKRWGCSWIVGEYIPTKKNAMVSDLLRSFGFEEAPENWFTDASQSAVVYRLDIKRAQRKDHNITIPIN